MKDSIKVGNRIAKFFGYARIPAPPSESYAEAKARRRLDELTANFLTGKSDPVEDDEDEDEDDETVRGKVSLGTKKVLSVLEPYDTWTRALILKAVRQEQRLVDRERSDSRSETEWLS